MLLDVSTQCEDYGYEGYGDDLPEYEISMDTRGMNRGAKDAEKAFLSGDPEEVLQLMSTESQAFFGDQLRKISSSELEAMGNAFKNREMTVKSSTYAEFEFEEGGITFSIALGLQSDESWKIIRL